LRRTRLSRQHHENGSNYRVVSRAGAGQDIATICQHFHAIEDKAVKELKLEKFWERAPFPVEVPAGERQSRSDESVFRTTPWIATPPWLLHDLPETPGEVRFAKDTFLRAGRMLLLVPLTPQEAEERQREGEGYVVFTRLADGSLLEVRNASEWDRNNPSPQSPRRYPNFYEVILRGPSRRIEATVTEDEAAPGMVDFWKVEIFENDDREEVWYWTTRDRGRSKTHSDRRVGKFYEKVPATAAERELMECPMPAFGEYAEFVSRLHAWLKLARYDLG